MGFTVNRPTKVAVFKDSTSTSRASDKALDSSSSSASPSNISPQPHPSPSSALTSRLEKPSRPNSNVRTLFSSFGPSLEVQNLVLRRRLEEAEAKSAQSAKDASLKETQHIRELADKTLEIINREHSVSLLKAAHRREGELAARKDAAEESAKSHQLISQLQHLLAYTGDKEVGYMCQIQLLKQKTDDVQAELDMTYGIQEYYEGRLGTETAAVSRLKQQLRSLKSRANATQKCLVAERVSRAALGRELSQCAQEIAAAQADCHDPHQQLKAANAESAALRKQLKDAQQSASDAHVHSSELMREVETLKSDLASSKSKIKPAKVIDISASSSFAVPASAFAPLSSSTSSTTQTEPSSSPHTPTTASQATSLERQSAQKELAAETASRKDSEKQLSVLNEELQATKKRFAVRNYSVRAGWVWKGSIGQGRNGSVCPVENSSQPNVVFKFGSQSELEHEAEMMHELCHSSIIHCYGLFKAKNGCHLALERMQGTLGDIMKIRRLSVKEMVVGFYEIASALNHMHSRDIVDQDIHRGNILISGGKPIWKKGDLGSAARLKVGEDWNWIDSKDCRFAFGSESPELAAMLFKHQRYVPLPAHDVWALALLMLELVGGQRPNDQCVVLRNPVYVSEAQKGVRDPLGLPGQLSHMEYLAKHVTDKISYADKISLPVPGMHDCPALKEDEKAPYEALLRVMKACLDVNALQRPDARQVSCDLFEVAKEANWL